MRTGCKPWQVSVETVWDAAGFKRIQLPRQGKQPPEEALSLDSSETTEQGIVHVLMMLQSPTPTEESQLPVATDASDQSTLLAASAGQTPPSRDALQHLHSASAQSSSPTTYRSHNQLGGDASSSSEASVRTGDVQMTNDTNPPGEVAEADGAVAPEPDAAVAVGIEGNRARAQGHIGFEADMQATPETPGVSGLQAGDSQLPATA